MDERGDGDEGGDGDEDGGDADGDGGGDEGGDGDEAGDANKNGGYSKAMPMIVVVTGMLVEVMLVKVNVLQVESRLFNRRELLLLMCDGDTWK